MLNFVTGDAVRDHLHRMKINKDFGSVVSKMIQLDG